MNANIRSHWDTTLPDQTTLHHVRSIESVHKNVREEREVVQLSRGYSKKTVLHVYGH